jgi:signal transduction histidine kinase
VAPRLSHSWLRSKRRSRVALELAQIAAGFPLAASFAIAGGITAFREGRRRASLNAAVHELRRPLQVLSLSLPADTATSGPLESSLRLAAAAVDRLEREINGELDGGALEPISMRPLVEAAVARWRPRAVLVGRSLTQRWRGGDPLLRGDEIGLSQALDNLINNSFEHGGGEVTVEVREVGCCLRLAVLDSGPAMKSPRGRSHWWERARLNGRSRHGHGLRVVRGVAAQHGGSFQLLRTPGGTEARLELPLLGERR